MVHVPVMVKEVIDNLPKKLELMMDWTIWHGWHSKVILSTFKEVKIIGVDRDEKILAKARENLKDYEERVKFVCASYKDLEKILWSNKVDAILLDLGVNMEHFKDASRGFSIKHNGPLDMRFDNSGKITARWILSNYSSDKLKEVFEKWGDFKWEVLDKIVAVIVKNKWKIKTTFDLKNVLKPVLSEKKLAVIFQALRIETNQELQQLEIFLKKFRNCLNEGGRCLIITYHSIEDRLVKNCFKELDWKWFKNLTKKVIFPSWDEIKKNKPSRSAKLRIIEKI